jgi:TolB-like protein
VDPTAKNHQETIRRQLEKILSSRRFVDSERLSQFLRFVVEQHLAGKSSELKETSVAMEVFRRKDYDPKQDSIVRAEALRLRARLNDYYAGEGRADPVVIELPKGRYTPLFRRTDLPHDETKKNSYGRWVGLALAVIGVALVAIGWWWTQNHTEPIDIAVLPLENLSSDSTNEYFVDGLTDEIIRDLSVIDGLAVRSRTSSFAFKNRPRNLPDVAKQLGVDYIVEGSVLREGHQLRINAQLVRVRDDFMLWSGRFDRELIDAFAIQDEISRGIVNNMRLKLGHTRRRYETSLEAYDLYLRARAMRVRSLRGIFDSIGIFEQAIAKDASFAPAYAGLASAYAIRSIQFPVDHPPDELIKMRTASEKAIELDPLLAEAHAALALAYARDGLWERAENSFRKAIELDRNNSSTYADYALWLLWILGRNNEALHQLAIAEKSDPLSPEIQTALALVLISAGRFDEAVDHCLKMSAEDELQSQCLARARLGQGKVADAIQLLVGDPNPSSLGSLGYAYAHSGRRDEAEKMAAASVYANEQALIFAGLGDKDRTLEALDRMAVLGPQRVGMYLNYPELALLRDDLRLKAFRKRVGLPD